MLRNFITSRMESNLVDEVMRMSTKKTHDELFEIGKKLAEDGLDPACKDEQKICYLWRIYLHTQNNLQLALATVKELQEQQSEEMTELENYVEHIRSLSEEREAITAEFETENENLKGKVAQLQEDLQGYQNDDTREMLVEQGMDDIVDATHSEQIAYLLVERARLLDELEDTMGSAPAGSSQGDSISTPDGTFTAGQLYQTLVKERQEFERDLASMRDSNRQAKEEMKMENEEEIEMIMGENEKLQNLLNASRSKITELQEQLDDLETQLEELKESGPLENTATTSDDAEIKSLQGELSQLTIDREALQDKVRLLSQQIERSATQQTDGNEQLISLSKKYEDQNEVLRKLQIQLDRVNAEKENLEEKLSRSEGKVRRLQAELSAAADSGDTTVPLDATQLRRENRELLSEMDSLRADMASERICRREAEGRARRAEAEIKDLKEEKDRQHTITQTKLKSMESKVDMAESEKARCDTEITRLKNEHKRDVEKRIVSLQSEADELRTTIRELNKVKRDLERELSNSKLEIEMLQDKVLRGEEKLKRISDEKTRLQQHIDELSKKVGDLSKELEIKDSVIQQEQVKYKELVSSSEVSLTEAQRNNERLKEDVQITRAEMARKEKMHEEAKSEMLKIKGSSDDTVSSLRQELVASKHQHQEEVFDLNNKLEKNYEEIDRLRQTMEAKEEELEKLTDRLDITTEEGRITQVHVEKQLEGEKEKRAELEGRNKSLEEEASRSWNKLQDMLEKLNRLESENDLLKSELHRKATSCKDSEEQMARRDAERDCQLKEAVYQADNLAKQLGDVEDELEQTQVTLKAAEQELLQLQNLKEELSHKEADLVHVRSQLQSQSSQTSSLQDTVSELKQQLHLAREREKELHKAHQESQQLLLDVQAKLNRMKEQTSNAASLRNQAETSKKTLSEQVTALQAEAESLHAQLVASADKYDVQCKRYAERKLRTKNKLLKAREMYMEDKSKLRVEIERLEQDLLLTRTALTKEREWKDHLESNTREMLTEKRDLLTQLSESEELIGDQRRQLSMLEVKSKYLEDENTSLQERVDAVTKQKHNLDRVLKEYQMQRHLEEINMSSTSLALISPRSTPALNNKHIMPDKHQLIFSKNRLHSGSYFNALVSPRVPSPMEKAESLATSYAMSDISQDSVTEIQPI